MGGAACPKNCWVLKAKKSMRTVIRRVYTVMRYQDLALSQHSKGVVRVAVYQGVLEAIS